MRTNVVSIIVGARGTGKTDFTKNIVKASHHYKKLIIDTFDNPPWRNLATHDDPNNLRPIPIMETSLIPRWENGLYRLSEKNIKKTMKILEQNAQNALLVFEDATRFIGKTLEEEVKMFLYDSKQKNLDCVFIFHGLMQVPSDLLRCADTLTLFKTNEGHPPKTKYPWAEIPQMMDQLKASKDRYANITIRLN